MAATATTEFRTDSDRIREQAATLQKRADALYEQRMELLREVWAMEAEAERMDREDERKPLPVKLAAASAAKPETDTAFLERVVTFLETMDEASSSDVAEHLAVSQTRARTGLARLEAIGMVRRTGLKRGTRYRLLDDDMPEPEHTPAHDNVRTFGNYEALVRDAVVALDTFEFVDVQRRLPEVSENTLRRWLRAFEDRGWITSERVDGRNLYGYVPAEGHTAARPKNTTPEVLATREAGTATVRGGNGPSGRVARVGTPIVDALIREAAPHGVTVTFSAHRVEYRLDGRIVATSSKTPGASSLKGTRSQLRKAGVPV